MARASRGNAATLRQRLQQIDAQIAELREREINSDPTQTQQLAARHFALMTRLYVQAVAKLDSDAHPLPVLAQGALLLHDQLRACLLGDFQAWGATRQAAAWKAADEQLSRRFAKTYAGGAAMLRRAAESARYESELDAIIRLGAAHPAFAQLTSQDEALQQTLRQRRAALIALRESEEAVERAELARQAEEAKAYSARRKAAREARAAAKATPIVEDIYNAWLNAIETVHPGDTQPVNDRATTVLLPVIGSELVTYWLSVADARCEQENNDYRCQLEATFHRSSSNPIVAVYTSLLPELPLNHTITMRWEDSPEGRKPVSANFVRLFQRLRYGRSSGSDIGSTPAIAQPDWSLADAYDSISSQSRAEHQDYLNRIENYQRDVMNPGGGSRIRNP